ncbi:MAG: tRNA (adenosine(37)-N6)-threonylcarbamoyltransferase complex dimerization subunit type 1 TsaB [Pyrinomonadaceae bacterium]
MITVAIESAVGGGSVAVLKDGSAIASWFGTEGISRAEDLLPTIARLLRESGHRTSDIATVAVSAGPGSFTGIRIGMSTAAGLGRGLGVPVRSISILTAMAATTVSSGEVTAAIPMGRDLVCFQTTRCTPDAAEVVDGPTIVGEAELFGRFEAAGALLLYDDLFRRKPVWLDAISVGPDLAVCVGRSIDRGLGTSAGPPIFIDRRPPAQLPLVGK